MVRGCLPPPAAGKCNASAAACCTAGPPTGQHPPPCPLTTPWPPPAAGTGKSSLVCAICVGLAGKTSLLGRAEEMSAFVRRGSQAGWVQITLSSGDPMRPHVVS